MISSMRPAVPTGTVLLVATTLKPFMRVADLLRDHGEDAERSPVPSVARGRADGDEHHLGGGCTG